MRLADKTVAILLAEGVEDLEYWVTLMRLQEEGAKVVAAGMSLKPMRGKNGLEMHAERLVSDLSADNLDGLVIPGGWAPDKLRRYESVIEITRAMNERRRIIGIICHGGSVAISAGIVAGRRVTGSLGIRDDLVNAGGIFVDTPALRDGNQVWGRVVADIPAFCRELVAALAD